MLVVNRVYGDNKINAFIRIGGAFRYWHLLKTALQKNQVFNGILTNIWMAETREDAEKVFDLFLKTYQRSIPKPPSILRKIEKSTWSFTNFLLTIGHTSESPIRLNHPLLWSGKELKRPVVVLVEQPYWLWFIKLD